MGLVGAKGMVEFIVRKPGGRFGMCHVESYRKHAVSQVIAGKWSSGIDIILIY